MEFYLCAAAVFVAWLIVRVSTGGLQQLLGYYSSVNNALTDLQAVTTNEVNFSARNG